MATLNTPPELLATSSKPTHQESIPVSSQTEEITIGGKDNWFASFADFFDFCNSMSGVPSISDGPFIYKHRKFSFWNKLKPEEVFESVRVFITTPGLIALASQRNFIQADATLIYLSMDIIR